MEVFYLANISKWQFALHGGAISCFLFSSVLEKLIFKIEAFLFARALFD